MDLRDSGAIENDSDVVMFIYRPERYGIQINDEGMPSKGLAELIVSKNRHGDLGSATVSFKAGYSKFTDWEIENISSGFRSPFDHGNTF
jgi:replicative DNA helicase